VPKRIKRPRQNFRELLATRAGVTAREAAEGTGKSIITIRRRMADGTLETFSIGASKLIKPESMLRLMGE
jgi:hypothetical protein